MSVELFTKDENGNVISQHFHVKRFRGYLDNGWVLDPKDLEDEKEMQEKQEHEAEPEEKDIAKIDEKKVLKAKKKALIDDVKNGSMVTLRKIAKANNVIVGNIKTETLRTKLLRLLL